MDFLNFGLLPYFLPLAAIPIILHLLTLHRLKTVELSTYRFLFDSYVQQRRKLKFLEALLAILRTLFLLFLVLCIARPVVSHWDALFGSSATGRDVIMMFDTSASMGAVTDGRESLEQAKNVALEVVDKLGVEDRVTVLQIRARPTEICSRFSSDAETIQQEISSLSVSPSRANLFAAFSYLFGADAAVYKRPLIYLFTDLQNDGWQEFEAGQASGLIPSETEVIVVNVGPQAELPNRAVVGGAPLEHHAIVGLPIKLRPRVANYAETQTQTVTVQFHVDDKEISKKSITLKPGEAGELEFLYTPTQAGVQRARYQVEADRFPEDDSFLFTLNVIPQVKVLLVNGTPAKKPIDDENLHLKTALQVTADDPVEAPKADAANTSFEDTRNIARSLNVLEITEAKLNAEILDTMDVVILSNCGSLKHPTQYNLLCEFVARGGGLLIFPGEKVKPNIYSDQFFPAQQRPDDTLLSVLLDPIVGDPSKPEQAVRFSTIDYAHPVFRVFAENQESYFTKVQIYKRFPMRFQDNVGTTWPIAEFDNGEPALVEGTLDRGRVILSAFPFNTKWTNLPLKPEFVPLVLRMIAHVKRPTAVQGPSVVSADAPAELIVAQNWAPVTASITDGTGRATPLEFTRSNSRLVSAFEQTDTKGYYQAEIRGGTAEQPKSANYEFAVNLAPGESNFAAKTQPQITALLPNAQLTFVDASAEAEQLHGSIGNKKEIWRPLIMLLFVIIGVEFLLSTWGSRQTESGEEMTTAQRIREITTGTWVGRMTGAGIEAEAPQHSVSGDKNHG